MLTNLMISTVLGCQQHVDQPTHTAGHALDLVITLADTSVCDLHVGDFISDHALVCFDLDGVQKLPASEQMVLRRARRQSSLDQFASDLQASALGGDLHCLGGMSVDDLDSLRLCVHWDSLPPRSCDRMTHSSADDDGMA